MSTDAAGGAAPAWKGSFIMKTGLVLEGGALRTIFSSGVCDALLDGGVMVDYVIGVSAGIAYGVSYISRQPRRNLEIVTRVRRGPAVYGDEQPGGPAQQELLRPGVRL